MIEIQFTCGCGQKTEDLTKAAEHSNEKGYIMTIQGRVLPEPKSDG